MPHVFRIRFPFFRPYGLLCRNRRPPSVTGYTCGVSIKDLERTPVPRRRDAQERRARLLVAARREFAARGVDASLEAIAREADVAIGTLYRHFPTRLDLLLAALEPRLQEFTEGSEKAQDIDDPWEGFVAYLENLLRVQAGDRGFNDFLSRRFPGNADTERIHDRMCREIGVVLTRAQEAGAARPDITQADIVNLIWANGRMIDATSTTFRSTCIMGSKLPLKSGIATVGAARNRAHFRGRRW